MLLSQGHHIPGGNFANREHEQKSDEANSERAHRAAGGRAILLHAHRYATPGYRAREERRAVQSKEKKAKQSDEGKAKRRRQASRGVRLKPAAGFGWASPFSALHREGGSRLGCLQHRVLRPREEGSRSRQSSTWLSCCSDCTTRKRGIRCVRRRVSCYQ